MTKQLPPAAELANQEEPKTYEQPEVEEPYKQPSNGTSPQTGSDDTIDAEWHEVADNPENDELKRQRREAFKAERAMQKAAREVEAEKNSFANKAKEKIKGAATEGWGRLKKNLSAPVKRADEIRERNANRNSGQLTKADLTRALREKKGRESKGQFKAPRYGSPFGGGGKVGGTFPDVDPFGGMGGRGRNMMDLSFGGMGQRPPQPQQPQRQAPPKPKPQPMRFPDPFAGIKKGSGGPKQDIKVMGKGLGIGKGSGKKLKNMKDWFDF